MNRRKAHRDFSGQNIHPGNQQSTERRKGLSPSQHFFALLMIWKQFREPCDSRNKLHTHTDEHTAAEEQEVIESGRKSGGTSSKGIKQNAEGQHAATTESVSQPATPKSKNSAGKGWHEEQHTSPLHIVDAARQPESHCRGLCHPGLHGLFNQRRAERGHRGFDNERQHQQLINIKSKADRSDRANKPLDGSQSKGRSGGHGLENPDRQEGELVKREIFENTRSPAPKNRSFPAINSERNFQIVAIDLPEIQRCTSLESRIFRF